MKLPTVAVLALSTVVEAQGVTRLDLYCPVLNGQRQCQFGSNPTEITALGDEVVFVAITDSRYGQEPHVTFTKTNGEKSARLIKDIEPTGFSSRPMYFVAFRGAVYFAATSRGDREIWVTDGTPAGTRRLTDINRNGSSNPAHLTRIGDRIYFSADSGSGEGVELWSTDGTAQGTALIKNINPTGSSNPMHFAGSPGNVAFACDDGRHGIELWRTDGTAIGTQLMHDINPGSGHSRPDQLVPLLGRIYFVAFEPKSGREFWEGNFERFKTSKVPGARLHTELVPGKNSADIGSLTRQGFSLLFRGNATGKGVELLGFNVSVTSPLFRVRLVADIYPAGSGQPSSITESGGRYIYTGANTAKGNELVRLDPARLQMGYQLIDIEPNGSSIPRNTRNDHRTEMPFAVAGGKMYFAATTKALGRELCYVELDASSRPVERYCGTEELEVGDCALGLQFPTTVFTPRGPSTAQLFLSYAWPPRPQFRLGGMTGCKIALDPNALIPLQSGATHTNKHMHIWSPTPYRCPNDRSLIGVHAMFQAVVATNGQLPSVTNAVHARIGL